MRSQLEESIKEALKKLGQLKIGHLIYGKDWKPDTRTRKELRKHFKGPGYPKWMQSIDDWLEQSHLKDKANVEGKLKEMDLAKQSVKKEWEIVKKQLEDKLETDPGMEASIRKIYRDMEKAYEKTETEADKINRQAVWALELGRKQMEKLKKWREE